MSFFWTYHFGGCCMLWSWHYLWIILIFKKHRRELRGRRTNKTNRINSSLSHECGWVCVKGRVLVSRIIFIIIYHQIDQCHPPPLHSLCIVDSNLQQPWIQTKRMSWRSRISPTSSRRYPISSTLHALPQGLLCLISWGTQTCRENSTHWKTTVRVWMLLWILLWIVSWIYNVSFLLYLAYWF